MVWTVFASSLLHETCSVFCTKCARSRRDPGGFARQAPLAPSLGGIGPPPTARWLTSKRMYPDPDQTGSRAAPHPDPEQTGSWAAPYPDPEQTGSRGAPYQHPDRGGLGEDVCCLLSFFLTHFGPSSFNYRLVVDRFVTPASTPVVDRLVTPAFTPVVDRLVTPASTPVVEIVRDRGGLLKHQALRVARWLLKNARRRIRLPGQTMV